MNAYMGHAIVIEYDDGAVSAYTAPGLGLSARTLPKLLDAIDAELRERDAEHGADIDGACQREERER